MISLFPQSLFNSSIVLIPADWKGFRIVPFYCEFAKGAWKKVPNYDCLSVISWLQLIASRPDSPNRPVDPGVIRHLLR